MGFKNEEEYEEYMIANAITDDYYRLKDVVSAEEYYDIIFGIEEEEK